MSSMMKAVIADATGGPEVLKVVERPIPQPGPGEVLIRTAAAGVNRPDIMQRSGALPAPPDAGDIFGLEVSGNVVGRSADVDPAIVDTTVMALVKDGGYAEFVLAKADQCLPVPDEFSLEEAAILPEGLFTIWHNLFDKGGLQAGNSVLIEGSAGGIGTLAVQLAKTWGADVIATAGGPDRCGRIADLGAHAVDYRASDLKADVMRLTGDRGVDVVLDILGGEAVNEHLAMMAPGGRHIGLSFMKGVEATINLAFLMRKGLWLSSSTLRPKSDPEKAAIALDVQTHLMPMLAPGKVRPILAERIPLTEAATAHELLESRQIVGKVVLTVGSV